jgi:CheY-like chemotaxis protein
MLSRLLGEDVELVTSLASELGTVEIDSTALHQIIMNLAVNARDAMPDGGRLTIETSSVFFDESYRETHSDVQPGDYVMLAVTDTGTGMDAETQKRIFEPFFTTKEIGRGTGLGLSTVYGIVQQSRGHIWVYSELGVGTAFKIYFPQTGLAAPENVVRREQEIPRGSETILLVEDDSGLRKLNATLLQDLGYHVLQSSNGTEAIKMAAGHTGSLHLLLTDVVMPGMNGKQLATRLIEARPDLKVLFVSGHTDTVTGRELLSGSAAFLQKPLTRAVLANKLRELLDAKIQS